MEAKDEDEVDDQTRYTEVDPAEVHLDYEAVKSTARNLAMGIIRAKRFSSIKKERKPKIEEKLKKSKKHE